MKPITGHVVDLLLLLPLLLLLVCCRYYVTGQWTPAGVRPAADCWVMNRSMAVARKLLKQRQRMQDSRQRSCSRPATAVAADRRTHRGCHLYASTVV